MDIENDQHKPKIIISACLFGQRVRYDGRDCLIPELRRLSNLFELVPTCPEADAGLGVPRPPVELVQQGTVVSALGRDDKTLNVTAQLARFADDTAAKSDQYDGGVFKSRSPSCAIDSAPLFDAEQTLLSADNPGIFVSILQQRCPLLPLIDEVALRDPFSEMWFKQEVAIYRHWKQLVFDGAKHNLTAFHAQYAALLFLRSALPILEADGHSFARYQAHLQAVFQSHRPSVRQVEQRYDMLVNLKPEYISGLVDLNLPELQFLKARRSELF